MAVVRVTSTVTTIPGTLVALNTLNLDAQGKSPAYDVGLYIQNYLIGLFPDSSGSNPDANVTIYPKGKEPGSISLIKSTVTCYDTGGFDNQVNSDSVQEQPTVQIIVAAPPGEPLDGYNVANEIKGLFNSPVRFDADVKVVAGSGALATKVYYGAYIQGDINDIGTDENDVKRYSINLRLYRGPKTR